MQNEERIVSPDRVKIGNLLFQVLLNAEKCSAVASKPVQRSDFYRDSF